MSELISVPWYIAPWYGFYCLLFAAIMWAHGMQWWDENMPTTINRVITAVLMFLLTIMKLELTGYIPPNILFIFLPAALALWIWPGWMSYITLAIGGDKGDGSFSSRLLGTAEMTLRQALIAPFIGGLCYATHRFYWPLMGILGMGIPYLIFGYLFPVSKSNLRNYVVVAPHAAVGAIIAIMVIFATEIAYG